MASVYDYTFNQLTRIGDDYTDVSERNIQNVNSANYLLDNFNPCSMKKTISFATSQPNVNYSGGYTAGCLINESSELLNTAISRPKAKLSLNQRPYATVPYLGRGQSNVVLETQILQGGDLVNNKKSVNPSSEINHTAYSFTPMIPSLQATITNPANLIENIAAEGWIRGGLPSRDLARDKDYTQVYKN